MKRGAGDSPTAGAARLPVARISPDLIAGMLLCLVALALRVVLLDRREAFRDEGASWITATASLPDLWARVSHEAYPPLYAILLHFWIGAFGDGIVTMRLLSVAAGMGTVLIVWRWTHEAGGRLAGLVALAFVCVSPLAIAEAGNVRMYALETFFVAASWWLAWRLAVGLPQGRSIRLHALALAVTMAGQLWTSSYGLPTLALQLLGLGFVAASRSPASSRLGLAAVIVALALFLPWLPMILGSAAGQTPFWTPRPDTLKPVETWSRWIVDGRGSIGSYAANAALAAALAGLWVSGRPSGGRSAEAGRRYRAFALLSLALVPLIWAWSQARPVYDVRYFGAVMPALAGGVGIFAARVAGVLPRRLGYAAIALVIALLPGVSAPAIGEWSGGRGVAPATAVAQLLAGVTEPGDVVMAVDARSCFPLAYATQRGSDPVALPVPVLCWDSGSQPFFYGQALVPESSVVRASADLRSQLPGLAPGGSIWLIALANGRNKDVGFGPLKDGTVTQLSLTILHPDSDPAQIRELVFARP